MNNHSKERGKTGHDTYKRLKKAMDGLNPLKMLKMSTQILPIHCQPLGGNPQECWPVFLWQYIPALSTCIRPSVLQKSESKEDDHTVELREIIFMNSLIRTTLQGGGDIHMQVVSNHHPKRTNPVINCGRRDGIMRKLEPPCIQTAASPGLYEISSRGIYKPPAAHVRSEHFWQRKLSPTTPLRSERRGTCRGRGGRLI